MASFRERIETAFAALAFAERDLVQECRDILEEEKRRTASAPVASKRADTRPRVRV